jgi:putative glutamine amidotransferase
MKFLLSASKADRALPYQNWLETAGAETTVIRPSMPLPGTADFDALLLTGGSDIEPSRYGQKKHTATAGVLPKRDEMEFRLMDLFLSARLPVLGICRGLQVIQVFLGGSLLQHIPDSVPDEEECHRRNDQDAEHALAWRHGTAMAAALGATASRCNSAHHQAADAATEARGLLVAATSPAGIIEAIESSPAGDTFISCVQWHPERMDARLKASGGLRAYWMKQVTDRA